MPTFTDSCAVPLSSSSDSYSGTSAKKRMGSRAVSSAMSGPVALACQSAAAAAAALLASGADAAFFCDRCKLPAYGEVNVLTHSAHTNAQQLDCTSSTPLRYAVAACVVSLRGATPLQGPGALPGLTSHASKQRPWRARLCARPAICWRVPPADTPVELARLLCPRFRARPEQGKRTCAGGRPSSTHAASASAALNSITGPDECVSRK